MDVLNVIGVLKSLSMGVGSELLFYVTVCAFSGYLTSPQPLSKACLSADRERELEE
jgi:hypothetical protein